MNKISDFEKSVYKACSKIPKGRVSTYKEIAIAIKNPTSSRAVGNALNKNPFSPKVPCHRVIKSDSTIGGFAGGTKNKIKIIEKEGIKIKDYKIVDFKKKFFRF
jgi:methylated-DNA-[protein]-cysteine S-methyltransferase